ncbi:hypothetical protein CN235_31460 [Sinorhizobium meliloti]|nr:hypothetical protein CN235_31460 [Sinorhizobium meliloti]RVH02097.1 hypothetical protein CN216_35100 [Sinorhizobium meliloti]
MALREAHKSQAVHNLVPLAGECSKSPSGIPSGVTDRFIFMLMKGVDLVFLDVKTSAIPTVSGPNLA